MALVLWVTRRCPDLRYSLMGIALACREQLRRLSAQRRVVSSFAHSSLGRLLES